MTPHDEALAGTTMQPSRALLARMPSLVTHQSVSGIEALHYTDADVNGAICATQTEAMLLYHLARMHAPRQALEIGSYVGWTAAHLLAGGVGFLDCVDDMSVAGERACQQERTLQNNLRLWSNWHLWRGTSPAILAEIAPPVGWQLAFVDGYHHEGQPQRDVAAVAERMTDDGVIVLHDVWLPDPKAAGEWLLARDWQVMVCMTPNLLAVATRQLPVWWGAFRQLARQRAYWNDAAAEQARNLGLWGR